jgi:hypothetical protein
LLVFLLTLCGLWPAEGRAQVEIKKIEVNQSIGNQLKGHLNFVAGKNTVVRAFLSEPVTFSKRLRLAGAEDTSATATNKTTGKSFTLKPKSYDSGTDVVDFYCPSISECGNWAAGEYEFSVTVKGETLASEETYAFKDRRSLRILAIPVKANYGGQIIPYPSENYKTLWKYTRDVYPVSDDGIQWIPRGELDASADKYDINLSKGKETPGQRALWDTLAKYNPSHCTGGSTQGKDCYDLIVGFIPKQPFDCVGFTYGKPANVVTGTDSDAAGTVAHEMAHCYDIGDTYNGGTINCRINPAPVDWSGKNWYDRSETITCPKGPDPYEKVGAKIPAAAHAFDVNERGKLGVMCDFMGSEGKQPAFWITPEVYDHLFNSFAPPTADALLEAPQSQRLIAYRGTITEKDNAVALEPWESYTDSADIPDTFGKFTLKAVDQSGNTLATQALKVEFYVTTNPPRHLTEAPFSGTMRFPEGTARFQIVRAGDGAILKELAVSATPPQVSAVTPTTPGSLISGPYTITWTARDAEADGLTYKVEYNADPAGGQSEWMVLATELEERQWVEDFSQLPGGPAAVLRVTATDGVLAGSALSAIFTVPFKAPQAFIDELEWGSRYEYGATILLEGEGYDLNDGWLPNDKLQWTSDLAGLLGHGSPLMVENLQPGEHTITLTATNGAGLQGTAQIKLTVSQCTYAVSPHKLPPFKPAGGVDQIQVTATQPVGSGTVCTLTNDDLMVETDDGNPWIEAKVLSFKDNKGMVTVSLAPNDSRYVRRGKVAVLGNEVEVTQNAAACKLLLPVKSMEFARIGGKGSFQVEVIDGCEIKWWANKDRAWITITGGKSGKGDGTVRFRVDPNPTKGARTGHIWVNNHEFTVTQQPD